MDFIRDLEFNTITSKTPSTADCLEKAWNTCLVKTPIIWIKSFTRDNGFVDRELDSDRNSTKTKVTTQAFITKARDMELEKWFKPSQSMSTLSMMKVNAFRSWQKRKQMILTQVKHKFLKWKPSLKTMKTKGYLTSCWVILLTIKNKKVMLSITNYLLVTYGKKHMIVLILTG